MPLNPNDLVQSIPGFCQPVSSLMHLGAALFALVAAVPLVRLTRGSRTRRLAVGVYAFSVVTTLAISGTYHALDRGGSGRAVLQRMDYIAIWLLIAGTFTAVHGVMSRGLWRAGLLTFIWSYAVLGVVLQVLHFSTFSGVWGLVLYLGLGWVGGLSILELGRKIGFRAVRPIWYAGIIYSAGAVLEACRHPTLIARWVGPHELFHLAVIVGVALHWTFIRRLLTTHASPEVAVPVIAVPLRPAA